MGRKALPAEERRKAYTIRLLPEVAAWFEGRGATLNDGVNAVGQAGVENRIVIAPLPAGGALGTLVRHGEPPSGSGCETPFKCGRGLLACQPCREAVGRETK